MHLVKTFTKYISFNILGMLSISCYILADTFFIAQGLGSNGLTSLNLAIPVYSFINGCGLMIGIGGSTRYSILESGDKHKNASQIFTYSCILGVIFSIIFMFIGIFNVQELTLLLGADESVFDMTFIYLKIMLLFSPAFIFNNIMNAFVRNDGNPGLSMIAMAAGSFANIIFDYIFIFPCSLGMFGAILATGFSPLFGLLILSKHFIRNKTSTLAPTSIRLVKTTIAYRKCFDILTLGIPSLISEVASGIVMIIFNLIILNLSGNIGVAAYGIIANLSLVVTSIFTGIAQGLQPIISQAYGNGHFNNVQRFFKYGILVSVLLSILTYLFITLGHEPLIAAFNENDNPTLAAIAKNGLFLYFTAFSFAGMNIVTTSLFSSTEHPRQAFLISSLRGFFLIIPCIWVMSSLWEMTGVWLSFPITEAVTFIIALWITCGYFVDNSDGDRDI